MNLILSKEGTPLPSPIKEGQDFSQT